VTRAEPSPAGYTVADLCKRWRVGADKVRTWIKTGQLAALNTRDARCGRPRFVVTAEALADFERGRSAAPPPRPSRRRKRRGGGIDYFP
jgi:hypothetical protein